MIDIDALFKVSYGLYIVSSGDKNRGNGYISNTVFQVTADPPRFVTCCNKDNYTAEFIKRTGTFAVSVLHNETPTEIFTRFGYKSGRDSDKLEGMNLRYGETGVPIVMNECIAILECRVVQTLDVDTHILFIGKLLHSEVIDHDAEPITYLYYRKVKKAVAPKNAPTYVDKSRLDNKSETKPETGALRKSGRPDSGKHQCTACGYVYDEQEGDPENGIATGTSFEDLPDSWVCPVCGTEKEDFIEV
jgi:flavin reductase (DIM6/NTAB) family NADH-FMN oxidoreductase RutF/rubredoxin